MVKYHRKTVYIIVEYNKYQVEIKIKFQPLESRNSKKSTAILVGKNEPKPHPSENEKLSQKPFSQTSQIFAHNHIKVTLNQQLIVTEKRV